MSDLEKSNRREPVPCPEVEISDNEFDSILAKLKKGCPIRHACVSQGVHWKNFANEIFAGLDQLEFGIKDTRSSKRAQALFSMESDVMQSCLDDIRKNEKGHKGAEFYLERLYWRDFSSDARVIQISNELEEIKALMANQKGYSKCIK